LAIELTIRKKGTAISKASIGPQGPALRLKLSEWGVIWVLKDIEITQ